MGEASRVVAGVLVLSGVLSGLAMTRSRSEAVYLGLYAAPSLAHGDQEAAIEIREGPFASGGINRTFALHNSYYAWDKFVGMLDANGVFQPDSTLVGDIAHHRVPVISWKCDTLTANSDSVVAAGNAAEDANILATAYALKQFPGPVILRWFWEFNVPGKEPVCFGNNGGAPTPDVYANFIAAWRRIRVLFHRAGANNVIFLWNPGTYMAEGVEEDPHGFYPGNGFVDWIGVDIYQRKTESFADDFDLFYGDFTAPEFGDKPLMVGENGALPYDETHVEQQAPYLLGLLNDVEAGKYPRLKAYVYFEQGRQPFDWILDAQGGLAAMQVMANRAAFSPSEPLSRGAIH